MLRFILNYVLQNHQMLLDCVVHNIVTKVLDATVTSITNFVLTKATSTLKRCIKKWRQHFKDQHWF